MIVAIVLAYVSHAANAPVLLPVANDPTVSFRVWFKVGAQNDPAGKEGLAALTAEMLTDATRCQVMLVTLPEETPVNELIETAFAVEDRAGVALGPVVVNGCTSSLGDGVVGGPALVAAGFAPDIAEQAVSAAAFRASRYAMQATQIARLATNLPLPQIHLPQLLTASVGRAELEVLADAMTNGVEALL